MIQFEKFILSNGLKVIVHQDISTPIIAFNVLYNVGARDEDENHTGFAHLFEHLMFGGSVNIPNFDEPLQKVGGENNAFTSNDITNYYITLPKENLETAFWLESDRMLSLAFTEKSLEVQRQVVIEEFKQNYLNQPYGDVWLLLRPLAYQAHPYKWATIGKEISHIENATMQEVKDFFNNFYTPNNAILSVAGNIELDEIKQLTEKWFGSIPSGNNNNRNLPKEPAQKESRRLEVKRKVPANAIYKAYKMCSKTHPDFYATDLLTDILSLGNSSKLYISLIKEQKLFSNINAYVLGSFDDGLLIISGHISENVSFDDAENGIINELEKIKKLAVTPKELEKVKNKVESMQAFSETSVLNKAMNLAINELLGDANKVNTDIEAYRKVAAEDIRRLANEIFNESNSSTLIYAKED
ncbi:MAG: insulinase family protein [Flavobacteriales bacterium]|nr:insulinase family protein [Flavobacteriales bacterium]MCW8914184.1 insulinase family protein [Flavobacteriales bacterium]MCW8936445.1 insulinase family protein [Flavobacteriales bacterium]MCW8967595.1 insulinase family protein [Flavobacteriales bacterium]MCW8991288.1 insulinase family protein [Flavobacteriales bacterium]